ncbi:hypothetical protein BpHYR1_019565 [Brachionus plicatilis]|uniref:Uncharacterized protein n=1 Tax=Brachionus plicatilis TaxID=10195 RepID=A0A3M7Q411_BRAPC|nr:hypothetical protein BpHYR1_019565 [Brachionus plicatilis]
MSLVQVVVALVALLEAFLLRIAKTFLGKLKNLNIFQSREIACAFLFRVIDPEESENKIKFVLSELVFEILLNN